MSKIRTTAAAKQVGAALAAALLAGTAAAAAPWPTAIAAESGQIRVDLRASVGQEWFAQIGDREVELSLLDATLSNPTPISRTTTTDGAATFTDLAPGTYLVRVKDAPAPADTRVSYAPHVVELTAAQPTQTVAPKAQQVGVTVDPLTACNTPEWRDAAAPGTYVEYDFTTTVPNVSKDGTLGTYELTLRFSQGHTVQWQDGGPRNVIAAGQSAQLAQPVRAFEPAAARATLTAQGARRDAPVTKLEAPRLTVRGAGETVRLAKGADYEEIQRGNDEAAFRLTPQGLATLARLKAADYATTVETWVPARANDSAPWGPAPRDNVLGQLAATATLLADGMDETRTPVTVEHTNRINVVSRPKCFAAAGPGTGTGTATAPTATRGPLVPLPLPIPLPGGRATVTETAPATEVITRETTRADGSRATVTETVTRAPGSGSGSGDGGDGGSGSGAARRGGLASTGAGVLGITGIAALLIILGLWLRRRGEEGR